ncbi:MAG: hypothetical protein L0H12_04790, partial [Nitrosospira sp.]|nr:hypothetical protein [Nitrosospira sp.]
MRSFPADTNGGYDKKQTKRLPNYPPINTHDQSPKIIDNQTADHPWAIAIYSKRINKESIFRLLITFGTRLFILRAFIAKAIGPWYIWTLVHLYLGTSIVPNPEIGWDGVGDFWGAMERE